MFANRFGTAALAVLVLVAAVGPAAAAGGQASTSFTTTVEVTETATIITVQEGGSAASNAEVSISSVSGGEFLAEGTYSADADGTIRLPAPARTMTVELVVGNGDVQTATTMQLQVPDTGSWKRTVSLDAGATAETSADELDRSESNDSADSSNRTDDTAQMEARSDNSADVESANGSAGVVGDISVGDAVRSSSAAAVETGGMAWTQIRSATQLLGQSELLFDVDAEASQPDSAGNDVDASGEYEADQTGASGAATGAASASGVQNGSISGDGEAVASANDSSVPVETDGSVDAGGAAGQVVESESHGSVTADATGTQSSAAAEILGSVPGVVEFEGLLQGSASAE